MNLSWTPDEGAECLATAFEQWCEARGVHPDALGAWECFEATQGAGHAADLHAPV